MVKQFERRKTDPLVQDMTARLCSLEATVNRLNAILLGSDAEEDGGIRKQLRDMQDRAVVNRKLLYAILGALALAVPSHVGEALKLVSKLFM
jgi:hypothetical protein